MIVINCILFWAVDQQNNSFALYLNILNVLSYPILYMFISTKTIISKPLSSYLKMTSTNGGGGFKINVVKELRFVLKRPIIYVLFFFPIALWLCFYLIEPKMFISYLIQLVFSFYLGLNLFVIAIILKLYFKDYFSHLISVLGMIFISFVSIFDLVELNLKLFTFSLVLISFIGIVALYYRVKELNKITHKIS